MRQVRADENTESATARAEHLYRFACLLSAGDTHLARDLVREAPGRLYTRRGHVSRAGSPAGYEQTVLTRAFLARQRRRGGTERAAGVPPDVPRPADGDTPLVRALGRLPAEDRAVVVLRHWEGRSMEETAHAMNADPAAVRTRCARALGQLREMLGEELDERDDADEGAFEGRLGRALRDAGARFDADRPALVSAGTAHGRLLPRRRAAVVSAIGLIAAGGALLLPRGSAPQQPTAAPVPTPVSGAYMIRTLEGLLPEGEITDRLGRGFGEGFDLSAHVVHDDGRGPAAISVGVIAWLEPGIQAEMTIGCPSEDQVDSCVVTRLPDGSRVQLLKGYVLPDRRGDTKEWTASLLTPRSQYIRVGELNSVANHGSPVSRAEPPLSGEELKQLVTAEVWRRVAEALPEDRR